VERSGEMRLMVSLFTRFDDIVVGDWWVCEDFLGSFFSGFLKAGEVEIERRLLMAVVVETIS
jgi:hypothetical protein